MWHWSTVLVSLVVLNVLMVFIHKVGPWGIALTWIPARVIVLMSQGHFATNHRPLAEYTWCASLIPVLFLLGFHVCMPGQSGRLPRFRCAHWDWLACWCVALLGIGAGVAIVWWVSQSSLGCILVGSVAACLNFINIGCAPEHVRHISSTLSVPYLVITNVIAIATFSAMAWCTSQGYLLAASFISNLPIFSIVLLLGSSCFETSTAIWVTRQHVYMLSYQTWPSLAFLAGMMIVEAVWLQWVLACLGLIFTVGIQYHIVSSKMDAC